METSNRFGWKCLSLNMDVAAQISVILADLRQPGNLAVYEQYEGSRVNMYYF